MHRFPAKAWEQLLFPKGRAKCSREGDNLKHDPLMEYRGERHRNRDQRQPTATISGGAFTKAIASARSICPAQPRRKSCGSSRSSRPRSISMASRRCIWRMTRSSDIARTPDVRTRAVSRKWACEVEVGFRLDLGQAEPGRQPPAAAASSSGSAIGVLRKAGAFGRFDVVTPDSTDYQRIVRTRHAVPSSTGLSSRLL